MPLAIVLSLLMWGVVYQGYNAVFPSFYPELFPDAHAGHGDGHRPECRDVDHRDASGALRHGRAAPARQRIPLTIGSITFGVTIISALAAWSARETFRIR